jgi:integrase
MTRSSRDPWNKGRRVGARRELSKEQVAAIRSNLQGDQSGHDLCLFMVAIDTMLRADNLLQLRVRDVAQADGEIRDTFPWKQNKSSEPVRPVLTPPTQCAVRIWLRDSGKQPDHFLFTRTKPTEDAPISAGFYREIVKQWVKAIGLYPDEYSGHSLRRTKAIFMYNRDVPIAVIGRLLGHKTETATLHYLGITDAIACHSAVENSIFS